MRALALSITAVLLLGGLALAADRSAPQTQLMQLLNGSPIFVAAVSTDGGVSQNSCTSPSGASDAGLGDFVMVQCTQDHFIKTGNCSSTATTAGVKLAQDEKFYTFLRHDEMAVAALPADAGLIGTCRVYHLR